MQPENPLVLGGGHGVRAYLPQDLQRFSIDLDFYSSDGNMQNALKGISRFRSLKTVGYGLESEGRFKRYDSVVPADLRRGTVALTKRYSQSFRSGEVEPEFYVTISNTLPSIRYEMRKPKSYIGFEYIRGEVPVLSPAQIIASKIRIITHRKTKDLYKDVFDIYALFKFSDSSVDQSEVVAAFSATASTSRKSDLFKRFKETSDVGNARNAIRLPLVSKQKYLGDWKSINYFVRQEALTIVERAGALDP